jgi:hypothetical protein
MCIDRASRLFQWPEPNLSKFEIYKNLTIRGATAGDIFTCDWKHTYGDAAIVRAGHSLEAAESHEQAYTVTTSP